MVFLLPCLCSGSLCYLSMSLVMDLSSCLRHHCIKQYLLLCCSAVITVSVSYDIWVVTYRPWAQLTAISAIRDDGQIVVLTASLRRQIYTVSRSRHMIQTYLPSQRFADKGLVPACFTSSTGSISETSIEYLVECPTAKFIEDGVLFSLCKRASHCVSLCDCLSFWVCLSLSPCLNPCLSTCLSLVQCFSLCSASPHCVIWSSYEHFCGRAAKGCGDCSLQRWSSI